MVKKIGFAVLVAGSLSLVSAAPAHADDPWIVGCVDIDDGWVCMDNLCPTTATRLPTAEFTAFKVATMVKCS